MAAILDQGEVFPEIGPLVTVQTGFPTENLLSLVDCFNARGGRVMVVEGYDENARSKPFNLLSQSLLMLALNKQMATARLVGGGEGSKV